MMGRKFLSMKIGCSAQGWQKRPGLLGRFCVSLVLIACALIPISASTTVVTETPWRAEASLYRMTLFLGNLVPVPWQRVDELWSGENSAESTIASGYSLLDQYDSTAPLVSQISGAIANENRQALFESTTRALAHALTESLQKAERELPDGDAVANLTLARELYRAFEDGIGIADPENHRKLGRAWLEMSSSIGSRGVLGAGRVASDIDRFSEAKQQVVTYIKKNYDPEEFVTRKSLSPLPESSVIDQRQTPVPVSLPPGSFIGDQSPLPLLVLNFEEQGIDETDLPLVAYGDMLFDSPQLFGEPARSLGIACSSCHNRSDINQQFFIPGLSRHPGSVDVDSAFFNGITNDHRDDPLDIPSLRGLRFTGPYGRNGRFASLRNFTRNVIVGEFGGTEPTPFILDSLVAYMLEFDFLPNSRLLPDGRLTAGATDSQRRGEVLFRQPFAQFDNKSCASCHIPSASFLDRKTHNIGSTSEGYSHSRAGALDTPTLLGSRFTAPYFHDGSQPTLASVVEWFNRQFDLDLSAQESSDLVAYLEAVGDADEPYESFDQTNTPFRLTFGELTTFASTLDTLIPLRDSQHALLLIDTVADDLRLDASAMTNQRARGDIYQLATLLYEIG